MSKSSLIFKSIAVLLFISVICTVGYTQNKAYFYEKDKKIVLTPIKNKLVLYSNKRIPLSDFRNDVNILESSYNLENKTSRLIVISDKVESKKELKVDNVRKNLSNSNYIDYIHISEDGKEYICNNKFFVKFKSSYNLNDIDQLNKKNKVSVERNFGRKNNFFLLTFPANQVKKVFDYCAEYYETGMFEFVIPNQFIEATPDATPNDPSFSDQWGLRAINAELAWDITKGSASKNIAIIDTGLDTTHFEFDGKLLEGRDYTDEEEEDVRNVWPTNPGSPLYISHGTGVAGVATSKTNNTDTDGYDSPTEGVAGVSWYHKITPIQVFEGNMGAMYDWIVPAVYYAWDTASADIVNISSSGWAGLPLIDAIDDGSDDGRNGYGSIFVFSTGNDSESSISYISGIGNTFAVGAANYYQPTYPYYYKRLSMSNYGTGLDVVAPGDVIYNLDMSGNHGYYGTSFHTWTGTSFAAPHVSGVAALVTTAKTTLTQSEVFTILRESAQKIRGYPGTTYTYNQSGWNQEVGYGMVDALGAVVMAKSGKMKSNSSNALYANNGRKLAYNDGTYWLTYEDQGFILSYYYSGTKWILDRTHPHANSKYPSIAVDSDGDPHIVWYQSSPSKVIYAYRKQDTNNVLRWHEKVVSTDVGSGASDHPPSITLDNNGAANATIAYWNSSGRLIAAQYSSGTYDSSTQIAVSSAELPTMASTKNSSGNLLTALAYNAVTANSAGIIYLYYNHSTETWGSTQGISSDVSRFGDHRRPSIAASGDATDYTLHIAWDVDNDEDERDVIVKKASDWTGFPSTYTRFTNLDYTNATITGLSDSTAALLFQAGSGYLKTTFNGTSWSTPTFALTGRQAGLSSENTSAKYIWRSSSTPYQINVSSGTLSKTGVDNKWVNYREIEIADQENEAWLSLEVKGVYITLENGEIKYLPYRTVNNKNNIADLYNGLRFLETDKIDLPTDTKSLVVDYQVRGKNLDEMSSNLGNIEVYFDVISQSGINRIESTQSDLVSSNGNSVQLEMASSSLKNARNVIVRPVIKGLAGSDKFTVACGTVFEYTGFEQSRELLKSVDMANRIPEEYELFENYPNPFNPETTIRYSLKEAGIVKISVYNLLGQEIMTLIDREEEAGEHSVKWNGTNKSGIKVAGGVYIYKMTAGNITITRRMLLLK